MATPPPLKGKSFKYGMPVYGVAWPEGEVVYMCGGGGMGIKNRLVCAESRKGQLTDQVAEFQMGNDCPMRLALSPNGKSVVFAMSDGIRRVDQDTKGRTPKFNEVSGELAAKVSAIKGEVKALAFTPDGAHLALGFATGELRVVEWPSLKPKFELSGDTQLPDAVRDMDFSVQRDAPGRVLGVTVDDGTCELWDWGKAELLCRLSPGKLRQKMERNVLVSRGGDTLVQQLPRGVERVQLSKLRFARDGSGDLLTLANSPVAGGQLARWGGAALLGTPAGPALPPLSSCRKVTDHPSTCFDMSRDGDLLAFGTSEGGVVVATASGCAPVRKVLKAHMVFATGVTFSADGTAVLSVSADASALVTSITPAARKQAAKLEAGQKFSATRVTIVTLLLLVILLKVGLQVWREAKRRGMTQDDLVRALRGMLGLKDEL